MYIELTKEYTLDIVLVKDYHGVLNYIKPLSIYRLYILFAVDHVLLLNKMGVSNAL